MKIWLSECRFWYPNIAIIHHISNPSLISLQLQVMMWSFLYKNIVGKLLKLILSSCFRTPQREESRKLTGLRILCVLGLQIYWCYINSIYLEQSVLSHIARVWEALPVVLLHSPTSNLQRGAWKKQSYGSKSSYVSSGSSRARSSWWRCSRRSLAIGWQRQTRWLFSMTSPLTVWEWVVPMHFDCRCI